MTITSNSATRGFTLLEAILALGIFSLAALGLLEAINLSGKAAHEAAEKNEVNRHLRSIITETTRQPGFQQDVRSYPNRMEGILFESKLEPIQMSSQSGDSLKDTYKVTVRAIKLNKQSDEVISSVETLIYGPLNRKGRTGI